MHITVALSATLITLALLFYSIGVWAERIARYLKPWHVRMFWLGFVCDVLGTLAMHRIAEGPSTSPRRTPLPGNLRFG